MPPERRDGLIIRAALGPLALVNLVTGLLAAFAPRTFYDRFPFVASWVDQLPPYNEHLATDVGAFFAGFGMLLLWAAVTLQRTLVAAACAAWALASALHLAFHLRTLDLAGVDGLAQALALTGALVPALVVLGVLLQRPAAVEARGRRRNPQPD